MNSAGNFGGFESAETSHRPASFEELQSERTNFTLRFLDIAAIAIAAVVLINLIASAAEAPAKTLLILTVGASRLGLSALVALSAKHLGVRGILRITLLSVLALLPGGGLLALCLMLDFCPKPLETDCRAAVPKHRYFALMMGIGGLPIALALFLTTINPSYMSWLVFGSERGGASIPGIGIPCGWPLLLTALASTVLGLSSLRTIIRNQLRVIPLLTLMFFAFAALIIACSLFLLGPAMVQAYEMISSGAFDL